MKYDSIGSVTEYWLQVKRPQGWLDFARKDNAEIALYRQRELKQERPHEVFRCIERVITDRVQSSTKGETHES